MKSYRDKVAAVTGAGSGIGRALAVELARRGCHVALADINPDGLAETVQMLSGFGVKVTRATLDVSQRKLVEDWADTVRRDFGQVNLVFNNAGVALSGTVADLEISDYEWIMAINFWGVVYGTKAFLPYLEASGDGHVVNISSVFGLTSQPLMSGYNASKFAVRGFTESLRQDLELTRSCVSATCVHPGGIKTNIARAARTSPSVREITGKDALESAREFERAFITSADAAARTILDGVARNRRRVLIGPDARLFDMMARLAPASYQRVFISFFRSRAKSG